MNIRKFLTMITASICMIALILDSRTGVAGASAGIDLCIQTLIPSLFPFFVLSVLLTSALLGQPLRFLAPIAKFCRIPTGSESLLAIGFLGGYPVGAQNVVLAWKQGVLCDSDARRMVVFCNNAGPAFLFGFLGQLFENPVYPWILWLTHITSALITGYLLPGGTTQKLLLINSKNISLSEALEKSLRVMGIVCGWVILFRILQEFLQKWILWRFSIPMQVLFTGLLELSNGCVQLQYIPSDGWKLLIISLLLGLGGLCVCFQTYSLAKGLSLGLYLPGKLLHGSIGFLLSYWIQRMVLENPAHLSPFIWANLLLLILLFAGIVRKSEKSVAFSTSLLYNVESCEKRRTICCFGKRSKNPAHTAVTAPN